MVKRVLIIVLVIFVFFPLSTIRSEDNKSKVFVFTNVNIIPMDRDRILNDQIVIIRDGKINAIGSSSMEVPVGSVIIDAEGKYLIPALADMHVHLEGDAWNLVCPPGAKFSTEEIDFSDILFVYIANGITMIDIMSALPEHIQLREKIQKNEILGPRLVLSKMIDGPGKAWPPPISKWVKNGEEAARAVKEFVKQGYDRIKVYSFLSKESYDAIIKTAKELKIPVDGHIPLSVTPEYIVKSGQNMIAHAEEVMKFAKDHSPEQIKYYAGLIADSNTWIDSTMILSKNLISLFEDDGKEFSKSGTEYLHPLGSMIWSFVFEKLYKPIPEKIKKSIKDGYNSFQIPFVYEFHKQGGKLLAGTDSLIPSTLPAVSLHKELEIMVNAGLSNFEALKASTTNPYEFLGESDMSGTIMKGKNANLLLLEKNPLNNISNTRSIAGVMINGVWISKEQIDIRMKKISEKYKLLRNKKINNLK